MNPSITKLVENDDIQTFTLSGVNVSLANAIRRTILSDINAIIFKTTPYEENKATIYENTSRLNNEIIKQRLSCIPIHIPLLDEKVSNITDGLTLAQLEDYVVEVNVSNETDSVIYITTKDFKIKNIKTGDYLSKEDTRKIFPPNQITGNYIDFVRLRPKISEEIHGEKFNMSCLFSVANAKQDGMFNVVSTCSYGNTIDDKAVKDELARQENIWKNEGKNIEYESKNWKLLEGLRKFKEDSFDFILQTIVVYSNNELVEKACSILINKFKNLETIIDTDELKILQSENTIKNSFDIILENEDYTIGKVIEYILYSKYFENEKTMTYCGFKKLHPHDSDSIIRVAFKENITDKIIIKQNLKLCIKDAISVYKKISLTFGSKV